MSDKLRIATIGAGGLSSSRIYPCFHKLPIELVAVCDLDEEKAKRNAEVFGGKKVYTDYQKMLSDETLDAIIVCVGPEAHAKLAVEIMEHGLPVYTEKPPAPDAKEAAEVAKVSRKTGKICMTAFKKRFAPVYRRAKEIIEDESFGRPALLSVDYSSGPYNCDPSLGYSPFLTDFTVHIIDITRYLFGEVDELFAYMQGYGTFSVTMKHIKGGLTNLALTCHRSWAIPTEQIEITGEEREFVRISNSTVLSYWSKDSLVEGMEPNFSISRGDSLVETGFLGELQEFVAAVKEDRQPESNIESSARTMLLHDNIMAAAESSEPRKIDYSILHK